VKGGERWVEEEEGVRSAERLASLSSLSLSSLVVADLTIILIKQIKEF